jgi:hypothetical protein
MLSAELKFEIFELFLSVLVETQSSTELKKYFVELTLWSVDLISMFCAFSLFNFILPV